MPDISLTTDIIVGFPGEDRRRFSGNHGCGGEVRYDSAFTFIYSKRTGTPAAVMEDQVPEDVVKDRFDRLLKKVQEIGREMSSRDTELSRKCWLKSRTARILIWSPDGFPIICWSISREMFH